MIRDIAREHDSCAEFAHSASKRENDAGNDTVLSVGNDDMAENIPIGNAEGLSGGDNIRVNEFKSGASGTVHNGKAHDNGGDNGGFPREDKRNIEVKEELPDGRAFTEDDKQEKTDGSRWKNHREHNDCVGEGFSAIEFGDEIS